MFTKISPYSFGLLTWHDGDIPADEVWIKIGGDKGGSSFKMNFQVVNKPCPNSVANTGISSPRHHHQFARGSGQIQATASRSGRLSVEVFCRMRLACTLINIVCKVCRYKQVLVFLTGDYEFLCRMCGIAGATSTVT